MGYNLTIGEAIIEYDDQDGIESSCGISARVERHDEAPAFGEPTDFTNRRWPSYSVWFDFCEAAGLIDVFYHDRHGMRGGHPGCFPIESEMQQRIKTALESFKAANPTAKAILDTTTNSYLCRLIWLDYWVTWALENCERPVFANR